MSQNSPDLANYSPWYVLMFDTSLPCISSYLKKNLTVSSGSCLLCVQNIYSLLFLTHTTNSTLVNHLINVSFRK